MTDSKNGQGSLKANSNRAHDRMPNHVGEIVWKDATYRLAGWDKEKDGKRMISLSSSLAGAGPGAPSARGYIIVNDNRTNEKQGEWRGRVTLGEEEVWLSGWNKAQGAEPAISLRANEMTNPGHKAGGQTLTTTPPPSAPSSGAGAGSSAPASGGLPSDPFGDIFTPLG